MEGAGAVGAPGLSVRVSVFEARLVRIFDKLKGTQDLYTQLVRVFPDGSEKAVARTDTIPQGNLNPKWDDSFVLKRGEGVKLRFKVFADHFWRQDVLCGEAEVDLPGLWRHLASGQNVPPHQVQLLKRQEVTGTLLIAFQRSDAPVGALRPQPGPGGGQAAGGPGGDLREQIRVEAQAPNDRESSGKDLRQLLNRPEELEDNIRCRFKELVFHRGRNGRQAVRPEDLHMFASTIAQNLGVTPEVFGDVAQMFWRFETTGEGILYEEEAVKLILYALRTYRDATSPSKKTGAVQLTGKIQYQELTERFHVERELGRGGQGVVYLAVDEASKQTVVVKMYAKSNQKEAQESITQEFELLMALKHPKIARVFDIFQDWDNVYIVQEPYFGGDLTTAVNKAKAVGVCVDERWLARVVHQVLTGVQFLHNNSIVHSDLKEANVMVAGKTQWDDPQVIVIDFGLANKFTARSGVGGTPGYMPPEVWEQGLWTPRGDVFSIGVMIFTLRTGRCPFYSGRGGLEEVSRATRQEHPQMNLGSTSVQRLVEAMLAKRFLERPFCDKVMQDAWFQALKQDGAAARQPIDVEALALLAKRSERTELYRAVLTDVATRQNLAQLKDLNDLFLAMDVNNDGVVSQDELCVALEERGWKQSDIDNLVTCLLGSDGEQLSYDEFMGGLLVGKVFEENALLRQVFNEVDKQQKGWLSEEEVRELANRPALARVISDRHKGDLMKELDKNKDGRVTFEDFRVALGAEIGRAQSSAFMPRYRQGQAVRFWSRSYNQWIDCVITAVDASGAVQVDQKPGYWIAGDELSLLQSRRGAPSRYQRGQVVELWSKTFNTWIPCNVIEVDEETAAVQVDQKPGYWFQGDALETRLRVPGTHPAGRHAAVAGLGRQLLGGAFTAQ